MRTIPVANRIGEASSLQGEFGRLSSFGANIFGDILGSVLTRRTESTVGQWEDGGSSVEEGRLSPRRTLSTEGEVSIEMEYMTRAVNLTRATQF